MLSAYVVIVYALLFLIEIALLAALGWGTFRLAGGGSAGGVLGVAAVVAACVLWALFASPQPIVTDNGPHVTAVRYAVKIGLFSAATVLLAVAQAPRWVVIGFPAATVVIHLLDLTLPASE